MPIVITGASDDLIEVDGDIREEFTYNNDEDGDLLAFSDGTVLRIQFSDWGVWRITTVARGSASLTVEQQPEDGEEGTDKATLDGDVRWVVHGLGIANRKAS